MMIIFSASLPSFSRPYYRVLTMIWSSCIETCNDNIGPVFFLDTINGDINTIIPDDGVESSLNGIIFPPELCLHAHRFFNAWPQQIACSDSFLFWFRRTSPVENSFCLIFKTSENWQIVLGFLAGSYWSGDDGFLLVNYSGV